MQIVPDWKEHTTIEKLKKKVVKKGYSAVTVVSDGFAALKSFDYQLTKDHCKPMVGYAGEIHIWFPNPAVAKKQEEEARQLKAAAEIWEYYGVKGPQPGSTGFVPNKEWFTQALKVPVRDCTHKEKMGGGKEGASGAKYFFCNLKYDGPAVDPTMGLPEELFVKVRGEHCAGDDFAPELVV